MDRLRPHFSPPVLPASLGAAHRENHGSSPVGATEASGPRTTLSGGSGRCAARPGWRRHPSRVCDSHRVPRARRTPPPRARRHACSRPRSPRRSRPFFIHAIRTVQGSTRQAAGWRREGRDRPAAHLLCGVAVRALSARVPAHDHAAKCSRSCIDPTRGRAVHPRQHAVGANGSLLSARDQLPALRVC